MNGSLRLMGLCVLVPAAFGCADQAADAPDQDSVPTVDVPAPANVPVGPQGAAGAGGAVPVPNGGALDPLSAPDAIGAGSASGSVPCDVSAVVESNCGTCHGETPVGGAIRLTTHDDWHQASPLYDPTKKVYEVAQIRINNGEMPQGRAMASADLAKLDAWLASGALAADAGAASCQTPAAQPPDSTAMPVNPPVTAQGTIDNCTVPGAFDPPRTKAGPEETCYDFQVHAPRGNGAFTVPTGESYHEFYYAVPWTPGTVWTRYGADFDNLAVLHHYLVFTSSAGRAPGDVATNVTGTTLGTAATLIGGWAVGGCSTWLQDDVGGEIPPSPLIMIQWHMYNTTGLPSQDASTVQFCTVPAGTRPNTAGITFLGTENFNGPLGMPAGEQSFTTRCANNSGAPITVVGFNPHMHLLGTHMKTDLISATGTSTIFDMPFQFDYQVGYEIPPQVVMPGDTLETTCTFFNDTGANVAFGESTNQEMCYQFALSYPAGKLNNGALSLIGALNTCW